MHGPEIHAGKQGEMIPPPAVAEAPGVFRKIVALLDVADDAREVCAAARLLGERFQSRVCVLRGRTIKDPLPQQDLSVTDLSSCTWPAWETAVRTQNPSLVVMMEGAVPSECAWFGTTAQRFLRNNKWPLLVLRPHVPLRFASVLCLADFSEAGVRALRTAAAFARAENGSLAVLHVALKAGDDARAETSVWHALKAHDARPMQRPLGMVSLHDERSLLAAARCEVDELMQQVDLAGINTHVRVTSGVPVSAVLREVRESQASLAVAAQGAHLASTFVQMQSPAEELISVCPIPVLVQS